MDPLQARINLESDLARIDQDCEAEGWCIELWADQVPGMFVTISSMVDNQAYMLRLECSGYPDDPPSIKFINPETKDFSDPHALPKCDGVRVPPTADLCLNISREALRQVHPDWQRDSRIAWNPDGNPISFVLHAIQDLLSNQGKYHG